MSAGASERAPAPAPAFSPAEVRAAVWPSGDGPARTLPCGACLAKNRVSVAIAATEPARCECGSCGEPLFLDADAPLAGLLPSDYQHPLDRGSLETLRAIPGLPAALKWLLSQTTERTGRLVCLASFLRCDEAQFPELSRLLERARTRLGLATLRPELFLVQSAELNAGALGVSRPVVLVEAALLDQLGDAEVLAVLGHELGHLHSEHQLYRALASAVVKGSHALGAIGAALLFPLEAALLKWSRCAELTCDRAGLLASRDLGAALGVLLAMAGGRRPGTSARTRLSLAAFVRQARDAADLESQSAVDAALSAVAALGMTHPLPAWRVHELVRWVEVGDYLDRMARPARRG